MRMKAMAAHAHERQACSKEVIEISDTDAITPTVRLLVSELIDH